MYISNNGKFKEGIVWWDTEIDPNADVDIFFFIHDYDKRAENPYGFKTLEINLQKSKEEIWSGYKSNLRNLLRKSNTLGFKFEYNDKPSKGDLEEYVKMYNSFAEFKKLQKTSFELMSQLANADKLILSKVYLGGELITVHSHYASGDRTRLYQSFSVMNSFDSNTAGIANRALTNLDIFHFKQEGFKVYDFGGIGNVDGDNTRFEGIIRFKKQFGGEEKILWKGTTLNGERGKTVYDKYFKH